MRILKIATITIVVLALVICILNEGIGIYTWGSGGFVGGGDYKVIPLRCSHYDYRVGDLVLLDTDELPRTGDIVYYDANVNKSYYMCHGPGFHLARVIGIPGDEVIFSEFYYEVNGRKYASERRHYYGGEFRRRAVETVNVMWGKDRYKNMNNMKLVVPDGEYLTDMWVGLEWPPGEYHKTGSSVSYGRFTIKQEAVRGVVLAKVGHSWYFEQRESSVVY